LGSDKLKHDKSVADGEKIDFYVILWPTEKVDGSRFFGPILTKFDRK
jgi:hypothetical protein